MPANSNAPRARGLFFVRRISLLLVFVSLPARPHGNVRHDFKLAGGRWFDGRAFVPRTVWSVGGVFRDAWDGPVEATLDLSGTFVLGPYADAHTHELGGGPDADGRIRRLLEQGVFYLQNTNSVPNWAAPFKALVNRPRSVDVAWANGGLTGSGGHPIQIYEAVVARPPVPEWTKADLPDQAYVVVDDDAELERKWPGILAGKPDFLKVYLEHSEEYARRKNDPAFFGKKGLDPALVPAIVAKAHAAGLRVVAHAKTAADARAALAGGVDELAHLPLGPLTKEDAKRCAERGVVVVTTTLSHWDREGADADALHRANLLLLRDAGATVVFGVDGHPPLLAEVAKVRTYGVYGDAELVRMLTQDGPRAVFPRRKVGCLAAGCEASFLALEANPLEDFEALKKIKLRMKEGFVLRDLGEPSAPAPRGSPH